MAWHSGYVVQFCDINVCTYIDTSIVSITGHILNISDNSMASVTIMSCAALALNYLSLAIQRNQNVCSEPICHEVYQYYSDVVKFALVAI